MRCTIKRLTWKLCWPGNCVTHGFQRDLLEVSDQTLPYFYLLEVGKWVRALESFISYVILTAYAAASLLATVWLCRSTWVKVYLLHRTELLERMTLWRCSQLATESIKTVFGISTPQSHQGKWQNIGFGSLKWTDLRSGGMFFMTFFHTLLLLYSSCSTFQQKNRFLGLTQN